MRRLWTAVLMLTFGLSLTPALAQQNPVSEMDIDTFLSERGGALANLPAAERRQTARETLIAERVLDDRHGRHPETLSRSVQTSLASGRRQILLNLYLRSSFQPRQPTEAEIAQFVEDNPQLFAGRMDYRAEILRIRPPDGTDSTVARTRLERLARRVSDGRANLDGAMSNLAAAGLEPSLSKLWSSTEALDAAEIEQLEAIRQSARPYAIAAEGDGLRLVVLHAASPAPVDPAALQGAIRDRLIAEQFATHRREEIRRLAAPVLMAENALVPPPPASAAGSEPPRGVLARLVQSALPGRSIADLRSALAGTAVFGGILTLIASLGWMRLLWQKQALLRVEPRELPWLRRPAVAIPLGLILSSGAGTAAIVAGLAGIDSTSPRTFIVLAAGGLTLGIFSGWLTIQRSWRMAPAQDNELDVILRRPSRPLLAGTAIGFALAIGSALLFWRTQGLLP